MPRRTTERRWQLRDATAEAHQTLDDAIGGFSTDAEYRHYLTALAAFRIAAEGALPANDLAGWTPTRLAPQIRADLDDLGIPQPDARPLPPATGSSLLGLLYVLEGAVLGGQILRKRAAVLGHDAASGARHLAGTPVNWARFLTMLETAPDYCADEAAAAARAAFRTAQDAFAKHRI